MELIELTTWVQQVKIKFRPSEIKSIGEGGGGGGGKGGDEVINN